MSEDEVMTPEMAAKKVDSGYSPYGYDKSGKEQAFGHVSDNLTRPATNETKPGTAESLRTLGAGQDYPDKGN